MKGKVTCTCGWSWNKSDSSAKDMYTCHECGRDNSNNMKNGGWLENYNDSQASASEGMVGDGFSNVGRNYSPAWGGQFQEGGLIPIAQTGKATRADSLDVYNRALKIDAYYNNLKKKGWYPKREITPTRNLTSKDLEAQMKNIDKESRETYKKQAKEKKGYGKLRNMYPNLDPKAANLKALAEHIALTKGTRYATQDNLPSIIDPMAPQTVIDTRIIPKETVVYETLQEVKFDEFFKKYPNPTDAQLRKFHKEMEKYDKTTPPSGIAVSLYRYDPLSVKPFDLLTDEEKALRLKKYGTEGFPKSYINKINDGPNPPPDPIDIPQRQELTPIQPLTLQGLQQQELQADLPDIRQQARIPKSFNVSSQRQTMSGPSEYYNYNDKGIDIYDAARIKESSDAYNQYIQEKYKEAAKSNPKAQKRLEQLMQNVELTPNYQMGGNVYPVNYVPQAQNGKLTFLQPDSEKLPIGNFPYESLSSEVATSIGGVNGEPAYLIPTFKYGRPLKDPIAEFKKTGEHLGGPFKTHQEADEWERTVRHPAVEKGEKIMFPQEKFAMGGSIPGATGMMYARIGAPSNGPYAKKTKASAQNGQEMKYFQEGLDWKPKTISRNGGWLDAYDTPKAQTGYITGDKVKYGTPEYEAAYNKGEVITDEGVRSPIALDEVVIQNNYKRPRGFWEQSIDKYLEDNKDAGLFGALGSVVTYPLSVGQHALTYGTTGKVQDPSKAWGYDTNEGWFDSFGSFGRNLVDASLNIGLDPSNVIGAGELAALSKLTKEGAIAKLARMNTSIAPELMQGLKTAGPSLRSSIDNVGNISKNLEDLNYAKDWAKQYGYELPENLERIAQSDELTNRTIRGMMNRHNTFVRGVSTNWDVLAEKNPEILRHLEGKGFDLSTKEGTKQAAEYMATHVPIQTGYGRASLNQEVFKKGQDAIYTSNSIPTAEGYTYGQGYITKVKRPTNFSSLDRKDWIAQNNPKFNDEYLPDTFYSDAVIERNKNILKNIEEGKQFDDGFIQMKKEGDKYFWRNKSSYGNTNYWDELSEQSYNSTINKTKDQASKILEEVEKQKILRTERSKLPRDTYKFLLDNKIGTEDMVTWLKQQPYTIKQKEYNELGESLYNLSWNEQKPIRDKMDILKKEFNQEYNASVQEYMKKNHPEYDPIDRYSHYLHIGTPGEQLLQPVRSWEITPEIWQNKSRAHSNTYSKKLSALEEGGVIKDDRGYWNPNNWGSPVEIGSNEITMQDVPFDVLGISDEGDVKLMQPGKNYKFKGKKVTEFPIAKNGLRQEQKGLQNLDQLTNFTNYNTKQPGGWLDTL